MASSWAGGWAGVDHAAILARTAERQADEGVDGGCRPGMPHGSSFAYRLLQILLIRRHGQRVAAFVLGVAAVAADVGESDVVLGEQLVEPPPEVFVLDFGPAARPRGAASRWPSTWASTRSAPCRRRRCRSPVRRCVGRLRASRPRMTAVSLHAVVGGFALAAGPLHFLARGRMPQNERPAARARDCRCTRRRRRVGPRERWRILVRAWARDL